MKKKSKAFEVAKNVFAIVGIIFTIYHIVSEILYRICQRNNDGGDAEICDDEDEYEDCDELDNSDFLEQEGYFERSKKTENDVCE